MVQAAQAANSTRNFSKEIEAEINRVIAYLNDHVVPEVRRSSSLGLKAAAEQLHRMAEHLDRSASRHAAAQAAQTGTHSSTHA